MKYWASCDAFKVRSVEFPGLFRITPCFSWVEAVMSLMSPILGLSGAVLRFFSFSQSIDCIVLVAHKIVELQSGRAVFVCTQNEDYQSKGLSSYLVCIPYCFRNHICGICRSRFRRCSVEQNRVYWENVSRYKKFTIASTNIHWELVVKTTFLFQENCQELPGIGTYFSVSVP